jgi:hypothetical protein
MAEKGISCTWNCIVELGISCTLDCTSRVNFSGEPYHNRTIPGVNLC